MTGAPQWLDDAVAAFGRQMELEDFRLNDRGAAAVRFANGVTLAFEYAGGALMISVGVECVDDDATLKALLTQAHWQSAPGGRAVYLAKAGRGSLVVRLDERDVTLTRVESVFQTLWDRLATFRRAVA